MHPAVIYRDGFSGRHRLRIEPELVMERPFADLDAWEPRMHAAMGPDFGWERAAERYTEVYRRASTLAAQRAPRA